MMMGLARVSLKKESYMNAIQCWNLGVFGNVQKEMGRVRKRLRLPKTFMNGTHYLRSFVISLGKKGYYGGRGPEKNPR